MNKSPPLTPFLRAIGEIGVEWLCLEECLGTSKDRLFAFPNMMLVNRRNAPRAQPLYRD